MPKETKLKAFIATYYVVNENDPRSCAIIAYDKKEAGDIFIKWLKAKNMYDRVTSVVCQSVELSAISYSINLTLKWI